MKSLFAIVAGLALCGSAVGGGRDWDDFSAGGGGNATGGGANSTGGGSVWGGGGSNSSGGGGTWGEATVATPAQRPATTVTPEPSGALVAGVLLAALHAYVRRAQP